jgi:glycerate 2-kinase
MQPDMVTQLIQAALAAVEPAAAVRATVRRDGEALSVAGQRYDLRAYDRVFLVGGGKAGAPMAQALAMILSERLTAGWVNVKQGHLAAGAVPAALTLHEARHPVPDAAGLAGAHRMLELAATAGERDLVFCLISGGGSALLPAPADTLSLDDVQALTGVLLRCGATINEVNAVRKHVSRLAGGQLARAAAPATVVSLILSDVVGSPLDVIASGPTVPDPSCFANAMAILNRYGVMDAVPAAIRAHLLAGSQGLIPETPKPGGLLRTGPTNTNVNDLTFILAG